MWWVCGTSRHPCLKSGGSEQGEEMGARWVCDSPTPMFSSLEGSPSPRETRERRLAGHGKKPRKHQFKGMKRRPSGWDGKNGTEEESQEEDSILEIVSVNPVRFRCHGTMSLYLETSSGVGKPWRGEHGWSIIFPRDNLCKLYSKKELWTEESSSFSSLALRIFCMLVSLYFWKYK